MTELSSYPPHETWHDVTSLDAKAWPRREEHHHTLVPTTCFNCEAACGLLCHVNHATGRIDRVEGNPLHPASRGRNCAKGPATLNQIDDHERILHPLRQAGERGSGQWERVSWDEALDDIGGRIRAAIAEGRHNEVMYHVGRPGEDGYAERVLQCWGIDGHNSHTNICSSNARIGYQSWMGHDRPSSDFANAEVIFLISSHLESGHYFNPHAQRIIEAQSKGATVICVDPRLSNTGSKADHWLPAWPGTEPFLLLAIARLLVLNGTWERDFVRRWCNWEVYLRERHPHRPVEFDSVGPALADDYAAYTPTEAERVCGVAAAQITEIAGSSAPIRPSSRPTTGGPRAPATWAAGRRPGACSSSTCSPARWAPSGAPPATAGTSTRHPTRPALRPSSSGTNSAGRGSTRWPTTRCRSCCLISWPRAGAAWRCTSAGCTTRCGPTPTDSAGWRPSPTRTRFPATWPSRPPGRRRPSSPTTCCPWEWAPSATTWPASRRTPGAGSASASRCCAATRRSAASP